MDDLRIVRRTFGRGRSVVLSWCIYIFDVAVLQLFDGKVKTLVRSVIVEQTEHQLWEVRSERIHLAGLQIHLHPR